MPAEDLAYNPECKDCRRAKRVTLKRLLAEALEKRLRQCRMGIRYSDGRCSCPHCADDRVLIREARR
jgi:hypothetical protein